MRTQVKVINNTNLVEWEKEVNRFSIELNAFATQTNVFSQKGFIVYVAVLFYKIDQ